MITAEEFVAHHGIKGQKWGIRNKTPVKSSSDHRTTIDLRKKKAHQLTNKQIKRANERANLERNFNQLNPTKVQKGHAQAKTILALVGTAGSLITVSQTPAGKAAIKAGATFLKIGGPAGKHFVK